jgi:asparagine synthase (glutamine-hydrolysing)
VCGIVGFYGCKLSYDASIATLRQMSSSIIHRGPDDFGEFSDGIVGLAMRRLSIIDIKGGHQPVFNNDRSLAIIFNGEIYNYRELRDDLIKLGHVFRTQSDTEVILNQYIQDGDNCLDKFNGMFSFAIWDLRKKSLFIARDRMGVKPLYYYWDGSRLIFGSEIKAILSSGLFKKEINNQGVWDYLTFRYIPQPNTIWKNIFKLPPGHTLMINQENNFPLISRYWEIPNRDLGAKIQTYQEYLNEFDSIFLDSVSKRMIADVPVGILLSGGLDSSAVAAAASEVSSGRLNSYSVAFHDSIDTNELAYAKLVANHLGMSCSEIIINKKEFIDFLPKSIHLLDEPMADMASIPLYFVSKLAGRDVKVVLSGEGADEVLGGYEFDKATSYWKNIEKLHKLPKNTRTLLIKAITKLNPKYEYLHEMAEKPLMDHLKLSPPNMTNYMSSEDKSRLFGANPGFEDSFDAIRNAASSRNSNDPLDLSLYILSQSWLVEDLLMKADKMTMGASVELRVPFLDYRLVEWAFKAPGFVKVGKPFFAYGQHQSKRVLRDFARKRLPHEIIERPKQGFPVPVYEWSKNGETKLWMEERLLNKESSLSSFFDSKELEIFVRSSQKNGLYGQQKLWNLLILEMWLEQWQ